MNQEEVLVVDLDHTLIKTDLLHEQFLIALKKNLFYSFSILMTLFKGKIALKHFLSTVAPIDPAVLPYNEDVLALIQTFQAAGKKVILVSASLDSEVQKIAAHLGCFAEAYGSKSENLKGVTKLKFIQEHLGLSEWSYVGDSGSDLPLWQNSHTAYLVETPDSLVNLVKKQNPNQKLVLIRKNANFFKTFLKGIRAHQWVKNTLVFTPLFLSHQFNDSILLAQSLLSFVLFSFNASSIYILNDLFDLSADRLHPKKKYRPWASGDLGIPLGIICFIFFAFTSLFTTFRCDIHSGFLLLSYFILNLLYTFKLKSLLLIDVILLALMYNLRIIFGGLMTEIPISPWLLTFSVFFFLGLAFIKRFAELKKHTGPTNRSKARAYEPEDQAMIAIIGVASSLLSVLVFALYLNSPIVQDLYQNNNYLWLITPALLYWVARTWILVYRGILDDDPIAFAIKDKPTYMVGAFIFFILLLSI